MYKIYTCFNNCDLAVLGSPTIQQLISPLNVVPSIVFLDIPPKSIKIIPANSYHTSLFQHILNYTECIHSTSNNDISMH